MTASLAPASGRRPLARGQRRGLARLAGLEWRPSLDAMDDEEFLSTIRAAWSPERKASERRAQQALWRRRHPERAAIRDEILAEAHPESCGSCGSPDATLFVLDYDARTFEWRCRTCSAAAQAEFRANRRESARRHREHTKANQPRGDTP